MRDVSRGVEAPYCAFQAATAHAYRATATRERTLLIATRLEKRSASRKRFDDAVAQALDAYDRGAEGPKSIKALARVYAADEAEASARLITEHKALLDRLDAEARDELATWRDVRLDAEARATLGPWDGILVKPWGARDLVELAGYRANPPAPETREHRRMQGIVEMLESKARHHANSQAGYVTRWMHGPAVNADFARQVEVTVDTTVALQCILLVSVLEHEADIKKGAEAVDFSEHPLVMPARPPVEFGRGLISVSSCLPVRTLFAAVEGLGVVDGLGIPEVAAYCKHCALCFGARGSTHTAELCFAHKPAEIVKHGLHSKKDMLLRQCPANPDVRCCDAIETGRVYRDYELTDGPDARAAREQALAARAASENLRIEVEALGANATERADLLKRKKELEDDAKHEAKKARKRLLEKQRYDERVALKRAAVDAAAGAWVERAQHE